ncbi:hypothetical protein OG471_01310 [Streptomyces sp. NBC_01336]|uniref:hypothetical protein n=1 Tax=Streptomyces sp. NBC_01336 TaxID=2903829 RepID=UPI002E125D14|nr:hypothetical protein OG471_01310 [Streptomyces sp. NBC_01336]
MSQGPRVYGSEHDDPAASLQPGHHYREQTGGPLDGELIEVTGWPEEEITTGAYLITPHNTYGPGGRASYAPAFSRSGGRWVRESVAP